MHIIFLGNTIERLLEELDWKQENKQEDAGKCTMYSCITHLLACFNSKPSADKITTSVLDFCVSSTVILGRNYTALLIIFIIVFICYNTLVAKYLRQIVGK